MRAILSSVLVVAALAQGAGLKIVVVAGEDAVNIIQQRTAVAPVVEVRDRNDLPVAGVAVVFAIRGGGASFAGGSEAATVTTNAAGRATASGLTPTGNGAIQINVTATHQGQTATASISQTNFSTVGEAARAGRTPGPSNAGAAAAAGATAGVAAGAAAAGAGAGAGGGMSATTIAVIAGAGAAGAVVAAKALGGSSSSNPGTVNVSGPFQGTLPISGTFGGVLVCSWNYVQSGTLQMALNLQGSTVTGTLTGNGTTTTTLLNCPGVNLPPDPASGPFALAGPVTGSSGGLRFSQNFDIGGQGVVGSLVYAFTGTLNGGVVTGTLTPTFRQEGFGVIVSGTTTMPVTLR